MIFRPNYSKFVFTIAVNFIIGISQTRGKRPSNKRLFIISYYLRPFRTSPQNLRAKLSGLNIDPLNPEIYFFKDLQ